MYMFAEQREKSYSPPSIRFVETSSEKTFLRSNTESIEDQGFDFDWDW